EVRRSRGSVDWRGLAHTTDANDAHGVTERVDRRAQVVRAVAEVGAEGDGDGVGHAPHPPFGHLLPARGAKGKAVAPRRAQREAIATVLSGAAAPSPPRCSISRRRGRRRPTDSRASSTDIYL